VDGGDEGDTYNYSPPAVDFEVDRPDSVAVETIDPGPVRGSLRVSRTYRWPAEVLDGRRVGEEAVRVVTDLELRAGERLARVTTTFDNRCRDHRLRAWLPLPRTAESSRAECAFAMVDRGLCAEGGPHELGLPTFPSRRFVMAGGLTVVHEGLTEYEVVDGGRALALTLVRATGMLSRDHPAYRPNAAGPAIPVEGPQLQGRLRLRYAVHLGGDDPYALADQAWLPLEVATGIGAGGLPAAGTLLAVDGAEVSALHRVDGELEMRVFNPTDRPAVVSLAGLRGRLVDLRGGTVAPFDGGFTLGPWELATARLADVGVGRRSALVAAGG
jgi:alpha-mannosidase